MGFVAVPEGSRGEVTIRIFTSEAGRAVLEVHDDGTLTVETVRRKGSTFRVERPPAGTPDHASTPAARV